MQRFNPNYFGQPISKPKPLGPEHNPWFWNPFNVSVRLGPDDFRREIKQIDEKYEITWNPITERWQVFARDPKINHKICRGWKLVFVCEDYGQYIPLDQRTLAKAWDRSMKKWGSPNIYWQNIENRILEETQRSETRHEDVVGYSAGEYYDYLKPKVGYGRSNGSKCAVYG